MGMDDATVMIQTMAVLDGIMKVVEAVEANTVQQAAIVVALERISNNIDVLSSVLEAK
jgi:hypothetical protein